MLLHDLLTPDQILLPFAAPDKWVAIEAMVDAQVASGGLPENQREVALAALVARERSMTTGMEHGIAIPHAALDELPQLLCVLAIAPDGVPFESLDGQPGRILVQLLIPKSEKLLHIRTLASIAKLLSDGDVRRALLSSEDSAAAHAVLAAAQR